MTTFEEKLLVLSDFQTINHMFQIRELSGAELEPCH